MIAVVATLKIQDGKNEAFEAFFRDLAGQVRANEPGNALYQLTRSPSDPTTYKVLELYKDEAAGEAHRNAAHFQAAGARFGEFLAGRPEIERLVCVD